MNRQMRQLMQETTNGFIPNTARLVAGGTRAGQRKVWQRISFILTLAVSTLVGVWIASR